MTLGRSERRMEIGSEPGGERLEERAPRAVRWDVVLTWFMRAVAILWIFKGLGAWAVILGMEAAECPATPEIRKTMNESISMLRNVSVG